MSELLANAMCYCDTTCTEFDNIIKHSVKNNSLDVLKIKHLELNEKMEYTVTGAITVSEKKIFRNQPTRNKNCL
jgi:hypothetical protein